VSALSRHGILKSLTILQNHFVNIWVPTNSQNALAAEDYRSQYNRFPEEQTGPVQTRGWRYCRWSQCGDQTRWRLSCADRARRCRKCPVLACGGTSCEIGPSRNPGPCAEGPCGDAMRINEPWPHHELPDCVVPPQWSRYTTSNKQIQHKEIRFKWTFTSNKWVGCGVSGLNFLQWLRVRLDGRRQKIWNEYKIANCNGSKWISSGWARPRER